MRKNWKPSFRQWEIYREEIEFDIEKCAIQIMKSGKQQIRDGIELPNQEKLRTLGEQETYTQSGIFEADIIKYAEMKEKNILEERENCSKPNYIVEISSKGLITGLS